jgi:hypothetical protein
VKFADSGDPVKREKHKILVNEDRAATPEWSNDRRLGIHSGDRVCQRQELVGDVLEAGKESRIYAGLKPGTNSADLRHALANGTVADDLVYFTPKLGDAVFLPAGTVHSLGGDLVVFEVQENSDVTFRLYD